MAEVIEDFGKYAEHWWSDKSWVYPLHDLNNHRIPFLQESLQDAKIISEFSPHKTFPLEGIRILDVGCGGGILSEGLAKKGAETTGIDPSEEVIQVAEEHARSLDGGILKPRYFPDTIEVHAEKFPDYYDCVICSEVIEHVDAKEKFVSECLQALKPGGSIIITTPHKSFLAYFSYVIVGEYVARMNPMGTHHWGKFITLRKTKSILKKNNCKIGRTQHVYYDPLFKKWHRSLIIPPFNYFVHAIKPISAVDENVG